MKLYGVEEREETRYDINDCSVKFFIPSILSDDVFHYFDVCTYWVLLQTDFFD